MNDFETLDHAFAELEHRADAAVAAHHGAQPIGRVTGQSRTRWGLVAASAVTMLAVAGGAAALAATHGSGNSGRTGTNQAAGQPGGAAPTSLVSQTTAETFQIPQSSAELARLFGDVLGSTATFTVTDTGAPAQVSVPPRRVTANGPDTPTRSTTPFKVQNGQGESNGAFIKGELTAGGVTGGYDLQIYRAAKGETAWCDGGSACTKQRLADGSTLAFGREALLGAAGSVTYDIDYVRADGVEFLMHVSNQADTKGESTKTAQQPPLSKRQMIDIVTSDRW